jgi:methionyl-tRNA formyltransferase
MVKQPLVGVLSTMKAPLLHLLLKSLYKENVNNVCVIADEKQSGIKDQRIWTERTRGAFDSLGYGLYDFASNGLPCYLVKHHNGDDCLSLLERLQPAVLINGGTPRKLSASILDSPTQGVINVHPGVLPKYRGACCVEWAILNDDPVGNTAHFMTKGYDEGPIIDTELCHFTQDDDYVSMRVQVYNRSIALMARTVGRVLKTEMTIADGIPQSDGEFFRPLNEAQMEEVIEKVRSQKYAYMLDVK